MLDSKFLFTLVGLIITVFAICNTNMSPSVNEGFWGIPQRAVKVIREVNPNKPNGYSLHNNYHSSTIGHEKFYSNPSFQGILEPRMGNVSYGSNITYNMPDYKNLAVPCDSLAMADMATEKYKNSVENYGCNSNTSMTPPKVTSSSQEYENEMNSLYDSEHSTGVLSDGLMAVGDMTTIDALGQVSQPIVYDRYIYANLSSRLASQGDMIRGDLAITPNVGTWFNVSANPNIDLQTGALNVMGGYDNESARQMASLVNTSSGGFDTTIGGIDMQNQFGTMTSAAGGDIQISSFA
jgi:hypothetical protein